MTRTIREIQSIVAKSYGIERSDLLRPSNSPCACRPRQVATWLSLQSGVRSLSQVARAFSQHHATTAHSVERVEALMLQDGAFRARIEELKCEVMAHDANRAWAQRWVEESNAAGMTGVS